jgi:O-antigen/teichoic acid export membrane protein
MGLSGLWRKMHGADEFSANTALTAATNILLAALGMVSGVMVARMLGPRGRGELAAIQAWPSIIATFAMLGMPEAVVYYTARDRLAAGHYLGMAVVVALTSAIPFMVVGYLLMPLLLHAQTAATVRAGQWYLVIVPIFALVGMLQHPLRGLGDFTAWNLMRLMPNTLWIAVLFVAWLISCTTPAFVAAINLAGLASLILPFSVIVAHRVPGSVRPNTEKLWAMLHYGFPCAMTSMPQMLNLRLDQMLMAALLPPRDLGLYVVAVAWSGAATHLLSAVGVVTTPAVASAPSDADRARRVAVAARTTTALALLLCSTLASLTPFAIVLLFGERFRPSVPAALVLICAAGVLGLNLVLQEGLRGMGRPYAVLEAELCGLVMTALSLTTMLRPMGIMGAALASLVGYSTITAVLLRNAVRHAGTSMSAFLLPRWSEFRLVLVRLNATMHLAKGLVADPRS